MGRAATAGAARVALAALMLAVEVATKAFGAREVLRDVRLSLVAGEIVAIAGPSGCGKSSLLRIVAGLDRNFRGTVQWAAPMRLGMAFQEPRLLPWRSVRDNLVLAGAPPEVAGTMLAALGLAGDAEMPAARLSLGMARRVALVRALAVAPDMVLLDEPFASLDPAATARARNLLLRTWTARPCAMLLVTHDLTEAVALADRVLLLSGRPASVLADVAIPAPLRRLGGGAAEKFAANLSNYFADT